MTNITTHNDETEDELISEFEGEELTQDEIDEIGGEV